MSYKLAINEYAYSDKSMRAWLELDAFGIEFSPKYVPMLSDEEPAFLAEHTPSRSLPLVLSNDENAATTIWETDAAADILADRHPEAGIWPDGAEMRDIAKLLAARARTGFALLHKLPMNLHARYQGFEPREDQEAKVKELTSLLEWALHKSGGPFVCGEKFCAADAAIAPLATRLVTYGFYMTDMMQAYVEALYAHPSFRRWHACADAQLRKIADLHHNLPSGDNKAWPRQPTLPGRHYHGDLADAINEYCPYSGLPIDAQSLAEIDGMVVGFCNPFCCRRGMADAESWPTVMLVMGRV
ncbi:MAG: glutathione S-transferase family protein [Pseudomonadota bacterium]